MRSLLLISCAASLTLAVGCQVYHVHDDANCPARFFAEAHQFHAAPPAAPAPAEVEVVKVETEKKADHKPHWGYAGDHGPGCWSHVPGWKGDHRRHSPIDLGSSKFSRQLPELDCTEIAASETYLFNNGHTLQCDWDAGSFVRFGDAEYEVLQFHFHTYSEHTIDGMHSPMEMHVVTKNTAGDDLLVIGIFFEVARKESPFLAKIAARLPETSEDPPFESGDELPLGKLIADLDPEKFYSYPGSLTTPPASGIVTWVVLEQPSSMSQEQYEEFRNIMGNNFRPVQPLEGRKVLRSFRNTSVSSRGH